jgi:uncharacterized caspase-like protein
MPRIHHLLAVLLLLVGTAFNAGPAQAEQRIALIVGNAGYQTGALATPANDAGLIAQTLQAAGFDVVGARDLDQDSLRRALRDFLDKAAAGGPETVAFIYLSGYGLQLEGENYFIPVDAKIARDVDLPTEAVRISDYTRSLAALKLKASIVVLDVARAHPFARAGAPLAGGLALVEPEPGMLIAFNATPGTVAPEGAGPYGPYAQALAEMMREGGLSLPAMFERVRLRVNDTTKGAEVAWHASRVDAPFLFFERTADAPAPAVPVEQTAAIRARPIRDLGGQDAYIVALERDTLQGYLEFLASYPDDPMARRVRAIVAARREAITWRRSRLEDTPPAYWSYLRRYPEGPHAYDARRRLAYLAAAFEPPATFAVLAYDVPPPPPEEIVYIRRPVLVFDDPVFAFEPPPPPVIFLAPPPHAFLVLEPPPPPIGLFVLPCPVYTPVPVWVRPPVYVAPPPPNNVIYANIHNTVVINNVTNTVVVTNPAGQTRTITPVAASGGSVGPSAGPAAIGPALPPSVAKKAVSLPASPQPSGQPGAPAGAAKSLTGVPLPGAKGQPLPAGHGTGALPAPSAAITPTTPFGGIKPNSASPPLGSSTTPPAAPAQPPAAKLVTPTPPTPPSGSVKPLSPSPSLGGSPKPSGPPSQPPAAKLVAPTPPTSPGSVKPVLPSTPPTGNATPPGAPSQPPAAKLVRPPPMPPSGAGKLVPPSGANTKPLRPPSPAPATRFVSPPPTPSPQGLKPVQPPPPPAARLAAPPPSAPSTGAIRPPPAVGGAAPTPPHTYAPASIPRPAAMPPAPPPPVAGPRPAAAAPPPPMPAAPRVAQPQPKGPPPKPNNGAQGPK